MKQNIPKTSTYSAHLLRHLRFTVGQNIHHHRSKQKLPLRKLAKLTGVSELLLDHYELGKNEIALDEMLKIACALGVPVTVLWHEMRDCPNYHL